MKDARIDSIIDSMGWDLDPIEHEDMRRLCRAVIDATAVPLIGQVGNLLAAMRLAPSCQRGVVEHCTCAACARRQLRHMAREILE